MIVTRAGVQKVRLKRRMGKPTSSKWDKAKGMMKRSLTFGLKCNERVENISAERH